MKISASLHAADPLRLSAAVAAVAPHVGSLHIDIMDGRFASAFGFGEPLVSALVAMKAPPLDVHLMLDDPEPWVRRFAALGARSVAFHAEAVRDVRRVVAAIRSAGTLAYLAFLPQTPLARISPLLSEADGILLLTAPPGGGAFDPAALARLEQLPKGVPTIVDGRIEPIHFDICRSAGVELAVLGTALFDSEDIAERARKLESLAAGGQAKQHKE
jgi:ribulose-phosphate 3-epimerase